MANIKLLELKKIQTDFPCVKITSSADANTFIRQFYSDDMGIFESCFILLLNRASNTIAYAKISQGGIAGTVVDVRLIAKYAIDVLASRVILAHNHPSGNAKPSDQDDKLTKNVKEGLKILNIELADHIILTEDSYYSYADSTLLL